MIFSKQLLVRNELISMLHLDRIYAKPFFCLPKDILQFERAQKLWKEGKDDTMKYEETLSELKPKGQIRNFKKISYWSTLKPNSLNKTAIQNENDSKEQHSCS